jgi:hypothetical protein
MPQSLLQSAFSTARILAPMDLVDRRPFTDLKSLGSSYLRKPTTPPIHPPPEETVRERGSGNLAITEAGRKQIHDRAMQLARCVRSSLARGKRPEVCLYSSRWTRTEESAKIIRSVLEAIHGLPRPELELKDDLAPQSLGRLEGMRSVIPQ